MYILFFLQPGIDRYVKHGAQGITLMVFLLS